MQKFPRRWTLLDKVNFLQRKIILNSIAYYKLSVSPLSDREYDELSKQLVEMQKDIDISDTQYGYVMNDFDGTTGFDLYNKLNENDKEYLMKIAMIGTGTCNKKEEKKKKKKKKGVLF